jgi:hypothetical protein
MLLLALLDYSNLKARVGIFLFRLFFRFWLDTYDLRESSAASSEFSPTLKAPQTHGHQHQSAF